MAVLAAVLVVVLSLIATAFYSYVDRESPIDALALSFPGPFPKLEGVYASNTLLQNVEKLGTGKVLQPEDFVLDPTGKFLYVGTSDGWIKKVYLKDGAVEDWKRVGGRPLGLALGNDGEVIVCEPAQGLLKVIALTLNSKPCLAFQLPLCLQRSLCTSSFLQFSSLNPEVSQVHPRIAYNPRL